MTTPTLVVRLVSEYPAEGKPTYGLQPVYYYLSREQARMGHEVHVVARRTGSQPDHEVTDGVEVHRVQSPFSLGARRLLTSLTSRRSDAVIHSHATAGSFAIRASVGSRAPVVNHIHGTTRSRSMPATLRFEGFTLGYSPLKVTLSYIREKFAWSRADRLVTVSSTVKEDLLTRYGMDGSKIDVVMNGADPELFRRAQGARVPGLPQLEGRKVVLYVGHFGPRKGIFHLIRAMETVADEVEDASLVCVGGAPAWLGKGDYWEFLKAYAKKYNVSDRVHLVDKVPNSELPPYYSAADVFVLPSYYEAFAKVVIEAMACEAPVVATRMGGNIDALGSDAGLLVDFGDVKGLAGSIIRVLQDGALARSMGSAGRRRMLENFTWRAVADRIDKSYAKALEN